METRKGNLSKNKKRRRARTLFRDVEVAVSFFMFIAGRTMFVKTIIRVAYILLDEQYFPFKFG